MFRDSWIRCDAWLNRQALLDRDQSRSELRSRITTWWFYQEESTHWYFQTLEPDTETKARQLETSSHLALEASAHWEEQSIDAKRAIDREVQETETKRRLRAGEPGQLQTDFPYQEVHRRGAKPSFVSRRGWRLDRERRDRRGQVSIVHQAGHQDLGGFHNWWVKEEREGGDCWREDC